MLRRSAPAQTALEAESIIASWRTQDAEAASE
jgi:hypothetical protein